MYLDIPVLNSVAEPPQEMIIPLKRSFQSSSPRNLT